MTEENKPAEIDLITKAENVAARLEAANKRAEEILAKQMLSGRAEAPPINPVIDAEQAKKDRINAYIKSTGRHIWIHL